MGVGYKCVSKRVQPFISHINMYNVSTVEMREREGWRNGIGDGGMITCKVCSYFFFLSIACLSSADSIFMSGMPLLHFGCNQPAFKSH